ncbi:MAG: ABC transporter ATP-binding protein [Pirellulaceae bacterium]
MASIRLERVSCDLAVGRASDVARTNTGSESASGSLPTEGLADSRASGSRSRVLHDIDLTVESGECLTVLGPSGSGKTTLLRVIAGLERCAAGRIWLGEQSIESWSPARRRMALVFQETTLYPDWTVGDHLSRRAWRWPWGEWPWQGRRRRLLGGAETETDGSTVDTSAGASGESRLDLAGKPSGLERSAAAWSDPRRVAELLGLAELTNRKPHQLSGGERRRVALGRAVVREPAAFLFDEPFTGLDPALRWSLRRDVRRVLSETGATALLVTHDWREAACFPGRTAVLVRGRLRQVDRLEELRRRPADLSVAQLVRDEPLGLLAARWWPDSDEWAWSTDGVSSVAGCVPVWVAVEPRAWRVVPVDSPEARNRANGSHSVGDPGVSSVRLEAEVRDLYRYGASWATELGRLDAQASP